MSASAPPFVPYTGPLPANPFIVVPQGMIDKHGLAELERLLELEFGRPVRVIANKPLPLA